jgi:uncharacterized cupin superfamily protein
VILHWDEVAPRRQDVGPLAATWWNLGAHSVSIGARRIEIDPGKRSTPVHVHGAEEEIFFVRLGSGLSWQDGHTYEVGPGDCLVHRAEGEAHTLVAGPDGLDVIAFGERVFLSIGYLPRAGVAWLWPTWADVGAEPHPWQREIEAGDLELPPPEPRPPRIVGLLEVEPEVGTREGHRGTRRRLGRAGGAERTGLNHIALEAGQMGAPPHCHSAEEELFVVLEGEGTLLLGEKEYSVRPGHVVARPAGTTVAHAFRAGAEGLTFLAYGTREPNDICYYPRSGKIALWGVGVIGRIEQLDYWDGEP